MLRTSAYSFLLIAPAYIVADLAPGSSAASPQILQGGSLAVLCWVVWCTFPALQEAQESERKAHMEAQEKAREDFKESLDSLVKSIDKLAEKQAE